MPEDMGKSCFKQTKLSWSSPSTSTRITQSHFENLILKFVTDTLSPLSVVEQQSFKDLLVNLRPDLEMPSRYKITTHLAKTKEQVMGKVNAAMNGVESVATTTDCWLVHHRSFLGITTHWLNAETMKREYATLACRRLTGSHNYLLLGKEIAKVHDHFNITENFVATTTDYGSNFVKAFSVFGPCDSENEEATTNIDLSDALNTGLINEPDLQPHHRCAAHTLNVIATTDSECAEVDSAY